MSRAATMETTPSIRLLLEVWREVCRHLDLDESVRRLVPRLAQVLPVERVLVRRLDRERARLETVADAGILGPTEPLQARVDLSPPGFEGFVAWCSRGQVLLVPEKGSDRERLVPPGLSGTIVAGPLIDARGEPEGVVLFVGDPKLGASVQLIGALLEPLAVAVENDQRLGELARLREAVEADNRALLSRLQRSDISETIIGAEGGLRSVMARVEQVRATDVPVLILGETGSGKEVVARAIHTGSRRASGPFHRVNCGAIPTELVDSELFGHERGSFTGAVTNRKGWFERADGGTLFLDELGELPPAAQVRLLRVLQDGSFERVGGQRTLHVDVRIVAATHRDLPTLVERGVFREDLWYRLNVFPIRLPPLRERPEDLAPLAAHFAAGAGRRLFGVPLGLNAEDVRLLQGYSWPGNVRELASVIERAAILGGGRRLDVVPALGVFGPPAPLRTPVAAPAPAPAEEHLDAAMIRAIEAALGATRGRIEGPSGAAARLGINPATLRSRMRRAGVDWSRFRT